MVPVTWPRGRKTLKLAAVRAALWKMRRGETSKTAGRNEYLKDALIFAWPDKACKSECPINVGHGH